MSVVFIARIFRPTTEYGHKIYCEESVFSSYLEASLFLKEHSTNYGPNSIGEIARRPLGHPKGTKNTDVWYFNNTGDMLYTTNITQNELELNTAKLNSFYSNFSIGDIVFVKSFPYNIFSTLWLDIIGVVSEVGFSQIWISDDETPIEDKKKYIIHYINTDGYLDHFHAPEAAIKHFSKAIPEKYVFLNFLSLYLKGIIEFNKARLEAVFSGETIVEKVDIFDFKNLPHFITSTPEKSL